MSAPTKIENWMENFALWAVWSKKNFFCARLTVYPKIHQV